MNECMKLLDEWIVKCKNDAHEKYIKSSDKQELQDYIDYLEYLNEQVNFFIRKGNTEALKDLGWSDNLISCINDTETLVDIRDTIKQAFTVYYFNKSPKHQNELVEQIGGLR